MQIMFSGPLWSLSSFNHLKIEFGVRGVAGVTHLITGHEQTE